MEQQPTINLKNLQGEMEDLKDLMGKTANKIKTLIARALDFQEEEGDHLVIDKEGKVDLEVVVVEDNLVLVDNKDKEEEDLEEDLEEIVEEDLGIVGGIAEEEDLEAVEDMEEIEVLEEEEIEDLGEEIEDSGEIEGSGEEEEVVVEEAEVAMEVQEEILEMMLVAEDSLMHLSLIEDSKIS